MHKKIQDMAYGRFRWERPEVKLSEEELKFEVMQGEIYRGSFTIFSLNQVPVRGKVISSHPRIRCLNPTFSGRECSIIFEFESSGLKEGSTEKGEITVLTDGGEYSLLFRVQITEIYMESTVGRIRNLADFAGLAKDSWEEAFHIYQTPFFTKLLLKEKISAVPDAQQMSMAGMEQLLIDTQKKQPVTFTVTEKQKKLAGFTEDQRETIQVEKNGWGYLQINITSDNPALVPVKESITTEEFIGNRKEAEFMIRKELLHGGNNFGRITLQSGKLRESCDIYIHNCLPEREAVIKEHQAKKHEEGQLLMRLTGLYLDFRMKRMVTGAWAKESRACLVRLKELFPENLWYNLYQAQTFLVNKERQEAEWILEGFRREPVKKDSPLYAYYLYLTILRINEPSYEGKTFRKIQEIYHRNQEDLRLFLMMLYLDPQLNQSRSRKLSVIRDKVSGGMHSPILYFEAYYLIQKDVYLLQHLDDFERQVLNWAVKEHAVTEAICLQVNRCMDKVHGYHPIWYRILTECYRVNPKQELLMTICSYCIKWNHITQEQFPWFDKGVREELRIAGLYEAWLESAENQQIEKPPKQVKLYFQYTNNLNARQKAILYADERLKTPPEEKAEVSKEPETLPGDKETASNNQEFVSDMQEHAGSLRELEQHWKDAREEGIDTFELEEHFLEQLLFTEGRTEHMGEIFKHYYDAGGQEMILIAFLSYVSHRYVTQDLPLPGEASDCLIRQLTLGNDLNDIGRLACLKLLIEAESRTAEKQHLMEKLLDEFMEKGKLFDFYERLPEHLLMKYHLNDGKLLSVKAAPGAHVKLCCTINGEEQHYDMEEMYDGIYGKRLVLFYGEQITYSIAVERPEGEEIVENGCVDVTEYRSGYPKSSYDYINRMLEAAQRKDEQGIKRLRDLYEQKQRLVEETYKLL